jgi:hypothetical protein
MFSLLFSGIKISSFQLLNFKISQFYMKLDKKLILNIENIEYKSEKTMTNSSIEDIKKNLDILPFVLKWFQSIDIEKLSINDNIVKIVLNKDILSVENKFFLLDSKIDVLSKEVLLDINNLYLKDYKTSFDKTSIFESSKKNLFSTLKISLFNTILTILSLIDNFSISIL